MIAAADDPSGDIVNALELFLGQKPREGIDDLYFQTGIRASDIRSRLDPALSSLRAERDAAAIAGSKHWKEQCDTWAIAAKNAEQRVATLEKALTECAADWISPPTTMGGAFSLLFDEFSRRAKIAAAALDKK